MEAARDGAAVGVATESDIIELAALHAESTSVTGERVDFHTRRRRVDRALLVPAEVRPRITAPQYARARHHQPRMKRPGRHRRASSPSPARRTRLYHREVIKLALRRRR